MRRARAQWYSVKDELERELASEELKRNLKDAQDAQFEKDSDAIVRQRARTASSPVLNPPGNPAVAEAVNAAQVSSTNVNAVLVTVAAGSDPDTVAAAIRRWRIVTRRSCCIAAAAAVPRSRPMRCAGSVSRSRCRWPAD